MSGTTSTLLEPREPTVGSLLSEPEARAFCERYQLTDVVAETARLLREAFPANAGVELAVRYDPEVAGVSWLAVTIRAHGTPAELVRAYDAFLDRWVPVAPPHVRDRITPTFTVS